MPPQNFGADSFWDVVGTASTEFLGGFFLRFGGNCLHRILEWILFEMWRILPPQNFGADSFCNLAGLPPQNFGANSFWDLAGTASTEFWSKFFLRCGGNCLHRIFAQIIFEIRQDYLHKILGRILFEIWQELPPQKFGADSFWDMARIVLPSQNFGADSFWDSAGLPPPKIWSDSFWDMAESASTEFWSGFFLRFGGYRTVGWTTSTEFLVGFFLRCGGNCLHRILEWILFEMLRVTYCLHRIFGRILFETRRDLPPRTTGLVTIRNNFLANFLKRLFLPSPISASFARDNIICTKTGINVKQSYLLTYSPRVNFISPAMFYFCTFLLNTLSRAKPPKICESG